MNRREVRVALRLCMCLGAAVFGSASIALAQINTIRICNQGNTNVWVAKVWNEKGWLKTYNPDGNTHKARGWDSIGVGRCEQVFRSSEWWSEIVYLAIAYEDRAGAVGLYDFAPDNAGAFVRSEAVFCATREQFSVDQPSRRDAEAWCGRGREWGGKWWVPMPFILGWQDPYRVSQNRDHTYEFTVRPDRNRPVWWPFPGSGTAGSSSSPPPSRPEPAEWAAPLLPRIARAAPTAWGTISNAATSLCAQCSILSIPSKASVLFDGGKPASGRAILRVQLKIGASLRSLLDLTPDALSVRTGGQLFGWDTVRRPQPDSPEIVELLFVVPTAAAEFDLVVKGQAPVRLAVKR